MNKSLIDIWLEKIEAANHHNLTRFVFIYKSEYHVSEWQKAKWREPVKVIFLI